MQGAWPGAHGATRIQARSAGRSTGQGEADWRAGGAGQHRAQGVGDVQGGELAGQRGEAGCGPAGPGRTVPRASETSREANSQGSEGKLTLKLRRSRSPCGLRSTTSCVFDSVCRKLPSSCARRAWYWHGAASRPLAGRRARPPKLAVV